MIGDDAFCPKSGASLSDERHYDDRGAVRRAVTSDEHAGAAAEGELTMGALRSSTAALFNRFRRCHRRHRTADPAQYRKAALAIRRIKRTAEGQVERDIYVWYALSQRLDRLGFETEWMHAHARLRCPSCHGWLKFEQYDTGEIAARCGANCDGGNGDRLPAIRALIADAYAAAFDEEIEPEGILAL